MEDYILLALHYIILVYQWPFTRKKEKQKAKEKRKINPFEYRVPKKRKEREENLPK